MKDVNGNTLEIGDIVVTNHSGYVYSLFRAEIIGFTTKKVKLKFLPSIYLHGTDYDPTLRFPQQLSLVYHRPVPDTIKEDPSIVLAPHEQPNDAFAGLGDYMIGKYAN